jgi:hypothetical protein
VKSAAGVTHGCRLGVLWGNPVVNGSASGAILKARADESR